MSCPTKIGQLTINQPIIKGVSLARKLKILLQNGKQLKRSQMRGAKAERRREDVVGIEVKTVGRRSQTRGKSKGWAGAARAKGGSPW